MQWGATPLHAAAAQGHAAIATLLLAHNAAVNARNEVSEGWLPASHAALNGGNTLLCIAW